MAPYTGLRAPQRMQVRLSQYRAAGRVASLRIDPEAALGLLCLESWAVLGQGRSGGMDSLATSRLHPSLQNQYCRHPVHSLGPLLDADFRFAQDAVGLGRS